MNPEPDTVPTDSYVADLSKLPNAVTSGDWTRRELFRRCMVEYPRCMHAATPEGRRLMLSRRPALTNTPWDAVVAASMEHSALLHGCDPPAWGDEPERFLDEPVELLDQWCRTVLCHLPAPFTRRGIIMDPRNLDRRTGDEQWSPEPGDPEVRWPRDDWLNSWVEQRAKLLVCAEATDPARARAAPAVQRVRQHRERGSQSRMGRSGLSVENQATGHVRAERTAPGERADQVNGTHRSAGAHHESTGTRRPRRTSVARTARRQGPDRRRAGGPATDGLEPTWADGGRDRHGRDRAMAERNPRDDDAELNLELIEQLFNELDTELGKTGDSAEIYIAGGARMMYELNPERLTKDVDAVIRNGRNALQNAAARLQKEHRLRQGWLNDNVTGLLPVGRDAGEVPIFEGRHLTNGARRVAKTHARAEDRQPEGQGPRRHQDADGRDGSDHVREGRANRQRRVPGRRTRSS